MQEKNKTNIIKVSLSDQEMINLNILLDKYGGKASSFFQFLLYNFYVKECGGPKSYERVMAMREKIKELDK